jgi:hypothetical protein
MRDPLRDAWQSTVVCMLSIQFCEHEKGGVESLIMMLMHVLQILCVAVHRSCMLIVHITKTSNLLLSLRCICYYYEKGAYHDAQYDLHVRYPRYYRNQSPPK